MIGIGTIVARLLLAGQPPVEPAQLPEDPVIHGGVPAQPCQWPTAVGLFNGQALCSGTLVHPRVVLTAAHCIGDGPGPATIQLGESVFEPSREVAVDHCLANPAATGNLGPWDYAYCLLVEPIDDVPPTPPLMGCETARLVQGEPVVIAGFGASSDDLSGIKHWASTIVSSPSAGEVVLLGAEGTAACAGDSGGSAFVQLGDGSWRAFGIVSGGQTCEGDVTYVTMHSMIGWAEAQTGIDLTPCHDADGTWNPGPQCEGAALDPASLRGDWQLGCVGPTAAKSSSCGPSFGSEADTQAPTVAIASPLDGSALGVAEPFDIVIVADDRGGSGVREVSLLIGDQQVGSDSEAPWGFSGVQLAAGSWQLQVVAEDWRGNQGSSEPIIMLVGVDGEETGEGPTSEAGTDDVDESGPTDGQTSDAGGCTSVRASTNGLFALLGLWLLVRPGRRGRRDD